MNGWKQESPACRASPRSLMHRLRAAPSLASHASAKTKAAMTTKHNVQAAEEHPLEGGSEIVTRLL